MLTALGFSLVPRNLGYLLRPARPSRPGPALARPQARLSSHGPHTACPGPANTTYTPSDLLSAPTQGSSFSPSAALSCAALLIVFGPGPGPRPGHPSWVGPRRPTPRVSCTTLVSAPTLACLPVPQLSHALSRRPRAVDLCATCVITSGLFAHSSRTRRDGPPIVGRHDSPASLAHRGTPGSGVHAIPHPACLPVRVANGPPKVGRPAPARSAHEFGTPRHAGLKPSSDPVRQAHTRSHTCSPSLDVFIISHFWI